MNASEFEDAVCGLSNKALNKYIALRRGWTVVKNISFPEGRQWLKTEPNGDGFAYPSEKAAWEDWGPFFTTDMNEAILLFVDINFTLMSVPDKPNKSCVIAWERDDTGGFKMCMVLPIGKKTYARVMAELWAIWEHDILFQARDWETLSQIYATLDEILGNSTTDTAPSDPDASLPDAGKVHG